MLDMDLIRSAMARRGLSGARLAEQCAVSKEAVSNWLSGESIPRPNKLAALAKALHLAVDDLFLPDPSAPPEPVVAFRTRDGRRLSAEAMEAGEDVGRHLRQLLPLMGVQFTPRCIAEPRTHPEFVAEVVQSVRDQLGIGPTEEVSHRHLMGLMKSFGVLLVPVYWGGDKDGHENAMSVYLPDSRTSWVLLNIGCRLSDFGYWLAHELGHCLTLHALAGQAGEEFAELFARGLLSLNRKGSTVAGSKRSVADELFGTAKPSMSDLVIKGEEIFDTPVFRAMARWQKSEGGRSPAFVAATLNIKLGDAIELAAALQEIED